jgi:import receptor subunit TOM70
VQDYSESIALEKEGESSVFPHIQLGVARYKTGDIGLAEKKFKEIKRLFPKSAEVHNYYGEILLDRQAWTEALKSFDKSIMMDPTSPLAYINKGCLQ